MKWNWKKALVGVAFIDFTALTGYILYKYGYIGFWEIATSNLVAIQLVVDLTLALLVVTGLMIKDARERGTNVLPYLLLTLLFGSMGPMLYYLMRKEARQEVPEKIETGAPKAASATA